MTMFLVCSHQERMKESTILVSSLVLTGIARFRHAGRSTVNVSDVLMLGRRNEGLDQILRKFIEHKRKQAS